MRQGFARVLADAALRTAALSIVLVGCGSDPAIGAPPASAGNGSASSTSTSGSVSVATDDTPASMSSGGEVEEELPPGCGDGVRVKGEFCFRKIALPDLCASDELPAMGSGHEVYTVAGMDVHGDGHTTLFAYCRGDVGVETGSVAWFFLDRALERGPTSLDTGIGRGPHLDWDGDGLPDALGGTGGGGLAQVRLTRNLGGGRIAPSEVVFELGPTSTLNTAAGGTPIILDVDQDGTYEVLAGEIEVRGSRLYRQVSSGGWLPAGPHIDHPGCNIKGFSVVGDFDEDGYPDAVVDTGGTYCDTPWSFEYDPEWHHFGVLRSNPETGYVDAVATIPSGVVLSADNTVPEIGDFDHDGHLDAMFPSTPGVVFLRGRGDGTFDEPRVLPKDLPAASGRWYFQNIGDFDGDGAIEFLGGGVESEAGRALAFVEEVTTAPKITAREPAFIGGGRPIGDVNGDGITDFLGYVSESDAPQSLFVSAP